MTIVSDIVASIRAVFTKGQLNSSVMAGVSADLTQAIEELDEAVQPLSFTKAGAFAFVAGHIGGVVHTTTAGAQAASLASMAGELGAGREYILTVQPEDALNLVTVTPDTGVQIDNAGSGVAFVPTAGQRFQLISADGVNWFSGAL